MSQAAAGIGAAVPIVLLGLLVVTVLSFSVWGVIFAYTKYLPFCLLLVSWFAMVGWVVFGVTTLFTRG